MCILHIVFCTVCKYVLSICKLFFETACFLNTLNLFVFLIFMDYVGCYQHLVKISYQQHFSKCILRKMVTIRILPTVKFTRCIYKTASKL